jgi:hypothetical protein
LLNEKKRFSRQKTAMNSSMHLDNSMRHNGHRVVDESRRLKILRAPHPLYSPDVSPCDFWMFGDFEGKLKDRDLQGPEKVSWHIMNCARTSLFRSFKWYLNYGAIGCAGSLNMTERPFANGIFTIRLLPGPAKMRVRSHCFSVTLYIAVPLLTPAHGRPMSGDCDRFKLASKD